MIRVENLTKRFGHLVAVDDLSFTVEDGALFAFLGVNGAGKTTAISCMTTLLVPDSGTIVINDHRVGHDDLAIRADAGIVFQQSLLDPSLTVRENLAVRRSIYGGARSRIDELVELVDLKGFVDRRYGVLSGGEKRRADIARALFHKPGTLFLDEPTTGLDPASRDQLWKAIGELRETLGLTVLLTTHYMPETEDADYVLIIDRGRELASGTPMALRARHSRPQLIIRPTPGSKERVRYILSRYAPRAAAWEAQGVIHCALNNAAQAQAIIISLGPDLDDFQYTPGNMDDVFLSLTKGRKQP